MLDTAISILIHCFQLIFTDEPDSEPNPDVPVDENEEFSLVFTTNLKSHTIVYGAEMDGIRCDKEAVSKPPSELGPEAIIKYLSTKEFIELKTNRHIEHPKQETSFRFVNNFQLNIIFGKT